MIEAECCIVGGGPAGIMAGYLFARAGVRTVVLEKHGDFLRDFRGDTVHPSTIGIMHELGLLDAFLERPHQRLERISGVFGEHRFTLGDFSRIDTRCKFIALMPQWEFLDFLSDNAREFEGFDLRMNAEVVDLVEEGGRIAGVVADTADGQITVRAPLTIGADGRRSIVRERAGLTVNDVGAPIDVLWFRVRRDPALLDSTLLYAGAGHIVVTIDRGDYWQCAFVIPKGWADEVRGKGIESFRAAVAMTAPHLGRHIGDVASWDDVKLLTVMIDRLGQWSRPGLLCIGDCAHAMSPVGGVGINLAIQDAVATANLLAAKLVSGTLADTDLHRVQARREFPTRVTQFLQTQIQKRVLKPVLDRRAVPKPPLFMRIVSAWPWLQGRLAALLGKGVRPEHVTSPVG